MKISEADTNPPKKRPIDKKDGDVSEIVGVSLSSASCTSSWTPLIVIVVFSVDVSWDRIKLIKLVAVREPSSDE